MPGGDRTGPAGMGPMTGRAAGYCTGNSVPGYMNPYGGRYGGAGRAFGAGFGRGRGYRNRFYATGLPGWARYNMGYPAWGGAEGYPYPVDIEPEQEKEMLKSQSEALKKEMEQIKKRLDEISKEKGTK